MSRSRAAIALIALFAASCADDSSIASQPQDIAAPSSTTSTTPAAAWTASPTWRQVFAEDCICSDGSPYAYWIREADPQRVVLAFDGGGACFSAATCDPNGQPTYTTHADDNPGQTRSGAFDLSNPANPLADWTIIFMPYCTGDVHLGTKPAQQYGDGIVINHTGYINAQKGLADVINNYGSASTVLVTGSSAGGVPVPLFAGLVAEALPAAEVMGLADASGGYPSTPVLNSVIGTLWGTAETIPTWDTTADIGLDEYGIPDLYVFAGTEFPDIRWARFDHASDAVQAQFSILAGLEDPAIQAVLDTNEALVEGRGVNLPVYIAPGDEHTIMARDTFYDLEVDGVRYLDWFTDFINGKPIEDVG